MMRPQDAAEASRLGADAVGMIFHPPSRRNVPVEQARQIVSAMGPFVTPVGVFVDSPVEHVSDVAAAVGLRVVQLHGSEKPDEAAWLGRSGLKVLKSIRVDEMLPNRLALWRAAIDQLSGILLALVLETGNTPLPGGSGQANDWAAVQRHIAAGDFDGLPPVIAAGGLIPQRVGDVVRSLRPWAVDVSSGVESAMGQKSPQLMAEFISAVREADTIIS
jgi:phosphoribosylanthranilate isomerase